MSFFEYLTSPLVYLVYFCNSFFYYYKNYRNFFHVAKNKYKKKFPINAILKNGKQVLLNYDFEALTIARGFKDYFNIDKDILYILKKDFPKVKFFGWNENGDIFTIFFDGCYDRLSVYNKEVLDIGANIGDSAIYFALKGAKKVIALEPMPKNYEIAQKNIQINGLSNKIELLNAGCGDKKSTIQCNPNTTGIVIHMDDMPGSNNGTNVPITTLEEILEHIESDSCVLKMDCEGHEYDIILNSSKETLNRFSQIIIEYHYGYKNLKKKLEDCGFKVTVTRPSSFRTGSGMYHRVFLGSLFATK